MMFGGCVNVVVQQGEHLAVTETALRRGIELETPTSTQPTKSSAPTPGPHTTYPMEP